MTPHDVRAGLQLLRNYYAEKDGSPHRLNDAQWAVYIAGLTPFTPAELEQASHAWMRQSAFFPALSQLLDLLAPKGNPQAAAHLAWTAVERAIRGVGAYRGVTFADAAIGECVRQVFGSWPAACSWEWDSPGWAIKRQTFLAVFPSIADRATSEPVTLVGQHVRETPALVGHVQGLPAPRHGAIGAGDEPLTRDEAKRLLERVERHRLALVEKPR